ncbi:hypothetical protein C8R47DRAFT_1168455 [Mycena vitilis]|nr:hypothetical protein C8R47DRAFT_1168455 [Mycena vitilis]
MYERRVAMRKDGRSDDINRRGRKGVNPLSSRFRASLLPPEAEQLLDLRYSRGLALVTLLSLHPGILVAGSGRCARWLSRHADAFTGLGRSTAGGNKGCVGSTRLVLRGRVFWRGGGGSGRTSRAATAGWRLTRFLLHRRASMNGKIPAHPILSLQTRKRGGIVFWRWAVRSGERGRVGGNGVCYRLR